MRIYTQLIIAMTLVFVAASSVQASNPMLHKETIHQRPNFESIDTNVDGDIDFDEFSSHKLPHGDYHTIITSIDNNGVISQDEFDSHKQPHLKNREGSRHD